MKNVFRAAIEAIRDPLATKPTRSEKNAWVLADVFKTIISAGIVFVGMLPVAEILQLIAGHPEQFGEYGPLVSAACVLLIQLIRTFRQGKPKDDAGDDDDGGKGGQDHPVQPLSDVAGPWA